jgi:hypothetical protein
MRWMVVSQQSGSFDLFTLVTLYKKSFAWKCWGWKIFECWKREGRIITLSNIF